MPLTHRAALPHGSPLLRRLGTGSVCARSTRWERRHSDPGLRMSVAHLGGASLGVEFHPSGLYRLVDGLGEGLGPSRPVSESNLRQCTSATRTHFWRRTDHDDLGSR